LRSGRTERAEVLLPPEEPIRSKRAGRQWSQLDAPGSAARLSPSPHDSFHPLHVRSGAAVVLDPNDRASESLPPLLMAAKARAAGRARCDHRQHEFGSGKRQLAQHPADIAAEPTAADQHYPLAVLAVLVGELHGDSLAERVTDDRDAADFERVQ